MKQYLSTIIPSNEKHKKDAYFILLGVILLSLLNLFDYVLTIILFEIGGGALDIEKNPFARLLFAHSDWLPMVVKGAFSFLLIVCAIWWIVQKGYQYESKTRFLKILIVAVNIIYICAVTFMMSQVYFGNWWWRWV